MKLEQIILILLLIIISCAKENKKPIPIPKHHLYKIDNENWDDESTKDLITVIYQIPREFRKICRNEAFSLFDNYRKQRAFRMELSELEELYSQSYTSFNSNAQIITSLTQTKTGNNKTDSIKSIYINHFNKLEIGDKYIGQELLQRDTSNINFSNYKGFSYKNVWRCDSDTIYNTRVLVICDGYLFHATINLLNKTKEQHNEITSNFVKSLWVKNQKNGRGYGN